MSKQKLLESWRIAINELKDKSGMTYKQIGDKINESERTVSRVFTGESKNPGVDLVRRIINAMGGSMSEVFGEGGAFIASQDTITLQAEYDALKVAYADLTAENQTLKEKNAALTDELLNVVNYFIKTKTAE